MPTPIGVNYLLQFLQYYQLWRIGVNKNQKWMFILYVLFFYSQPIGILVFRVQQLLFFIKVEKSSKPITRNRGKGELAASSKCPSSVTMKSA